MVTPGVSPLTISHLPGMAGTWSSNNPACMRTKIASLKPRFYCGRLFAESILMSTPNASRYSVLPSFTGIQWSPIVASVSISFWRFGAKEIVVFPPRGYFFWVALEQSACTNYQPVPAAYTCSRCLIHRLGIIATCGDPNRAFAPLWQDTHRRRTQFLRPILWEE